jgi:hypothetical protein
MKTNLLNTLAGFGLLLAPCLSVAQTIVPGTTADFALFSTNGAVSNSHISQVTGNVGTNLGSSTAFGNVNGQMHDQDGTSAKCAADLLTLYNQLNGLTTTFTPAPALGNGQILIAGVYGITAATTIDLDLILDGQNLANQVWVFKIGASLSAHANAKVKLINGAQACNVYWKVEGLVSIFSGVNMKGTVIANNAAINLNTGDTLEGRALSTAGAVTIDGVLAYTPIGCGSPVLTGPVAPNLASAGCFGIFSSSGAVTNSGTSFVKGDIGTNSGSCSGYQAVNVTGTIHTAPDIATANAAADLGNAYSYLNTLPKDIELLYPAQFGRNLVLTPHTYVLNAATVMTDTLYLDAQGNASAVFVIKSIGAFSTNAGSKVILRHGTLASNVYWEVDGAVTIGSNSIFCGTIISSGGALGSVGTGVQLNGRAFSTSGAITTDAVNAFMAPLCLPAGISTYADGSGQPIASIFPNPFTSAVNVVLKDIPTGTSIFILHNVLGAAIMSTQLTALSTTFETSALPAGIYFYQVVADGKIVQTGKLISAK